MINPANVAVRAVNANLVKKNAELIKEINRGMASGLDVTKSVRRAWNIVGMQELLTDKMLNAIVFSTGKGLAAPILKNQVVKFKSWYMEKVIYGSTTFSDQIVATGNQNKRIIAQAYGNAIKKNKAMVSIAKDIADTGLVKGEVTKNFRALTKAVRLATDPKDFKSISRLISKTRAQVDSLANAEATSKNLKKAYSNLLKKLESGSMEQVDKALDRAVRSKVKYNTERMVRSENARAYGDGFETMVSEDENIEAVESQLSSSHKIEDICNFHSEADLHNLGPGVSHKDKLPPYPYHSQCTCILFPVYIAKKGGRSAVSNSAAAKYINGKSDKVKAQLVGANKTITSKNWKKNLKNYDGERVVRSKVPGKFYKK